MSKQEVLVLYRKLHSAWPYRDALVAAGITPKLVEAVHPVTLDNIGGLLLTGGSDVDPALYGENKAAETDESDRERDTLEIALLHQAFDLNIPVLAICRGLQILNVALNGTLVQHVNRPERHQVLGADRSVPAHSITIEPGTLLSRIAGTREWLVNSRHHQAVKRVGDHLSIAATDPDDGTIEALERSDRRFVLGVQWHPENQAPCDSAQLRIFQRFGEAMR